MSPDQDQEQRLMDIVDEYTQRAQDGERPSVDQYCDQHPDLADELRELLGVLDVMEDLGPVVRNSTVDTDLPDQIGDYRVVGEIGRGGMGVVYEAEQISLGRRVALKVLPQNLLGSSSAKTRFQREARATAQMHHTNIVPVFEVGEESGHFFYVMQLIDGRGLDEIVAEFAESGENSAQLQLSLTSNSLLHSSGSGGSSEGIRSSQARNARIGRSGSVCESNSAAYYRGVAYVGEQTAEALAYAHDRNVIHRDIKPSNLLLDKHGTTWVTDFGLAKLTESDEALTNTGDHMGTLRYMSPERFQGQCDERADIYALGMTLYELATKRSAFESADRIKLIYLITETTAPNPRSIDPEIPRDLETIILKAIEKEPSRRYGSANEMALELNRFLNDEPIKARRVKLHEQAMRWARRNRSLAAALFCVATMLIAFAIGGPLVALRQADLRSKAEAAQGRAESAESTAIRQREFALAASDEARVAELEAQNQRAVAEEALKQQTLARQDATRQRGKYVRNLFFSEMNRAGDLLQDARGVERVREILDRWRDDPEVSDLFGWEWRFLEGAASGQSYPLERTFGTLSVEWSPDGSKIAFPSQGMTKDGIRQQWIIRIEEANTGKLICKLDGHEQNIPDLYWHPRKELVASIGYDRIVRIWDIDSTEVIREFGPYSGNIGVGTWSQSGGRFAWSVDGEQVYVLDATKTDSQPVALPGSTAYARYLDFCPDGTHLATSLWFENEAGVYSLEEEKYVEEFTPKLSKPGTAIAWRGGHEVAYVLHSTPTGRIDMYTSGGELLRSFYGHTQWVPTIRILPGADGFVSGGTDANLFVWDIDTGIPIKQIVEHARGITMLKLSRDGRLAASVSSDSVQLWDTDSLHTRVELFDPEIGVFSRQRRVTGISWHKSGTQLATSGFDSLGRVWNLVKSSIDDRVATSGPAWFAAWHPHKPIVAFGGGGLMFLDTETGDVQDADVNAQFFNWNMDGTQFARLFPDQGHKILVQSFPELEVIAKFRCEPGALAWHPKDPSRFAYIEAITYEIAICEGSEVVLKLVGPVEKIRDMEWSPDGTKLAVGYDDNRVRIWDTETGQAEGVELQHSNPVQAVGWNHDGTRLASGSLDGTLRIWETNEWHQTITHRASGTGITSLAWSPDSSKIAAGDESGLTTVWFLGAPTFGSNEEGQTIERLVDRRRYLRERFQSVTQSPSRPLEADQPNSIKPDLVRSPVVEQLVSEEWQWSEPIRLTANINSLYSEDSPFLTQNGLQLYFTSDRPGGRGGIDIYVASRDALGDEWGQATSVGLINSPGNDQSPWVTRDGLSLYFCSDRDGVFDLFESKRGSVDEPWGTPIALPQRINSVSVDLEPTISADGLTLVFCSGRQPKYQVCDLMIAQRASSHDPWSAPKNLGPWMNSAEWQASPQLFGDDISSALIFHSPEGTRIASRNSPLDTFASHEPFPSGNSVFGAFSLFLWQDGRTLYFRRTSEELDNQDIWLSTLEKQEP